MKNQQTAVEWLVDWMGKNQYFIGNDLLQAFEQAKQMEMEQLAQAWDDGNYNYFYDKESGVDFEDGIEYYTRLYKKQD